MDYEPWSPHLAISYGRVVFAQRWQSDRFLEIQKKIKIWLYSFLFHALFCNKNHICAVFLEFLNSLSPGVSGNWHFYIGE